MIPTRLTLETAQVDRLVAAGRKVVAGNDRLTAAVANIRTHAGVANSPLIVQR